MITVNKETKQVVTEVEEIVVNLKVSPEVAALLLVLTSQASGCPNKSLRKYAEEFYNEFYNEHGIYGYDINNDEYGQLIEDVTIGLSKAKLNNEFFLDIVDKIKSIAQDK